MIGHARNPFIVFLTLLLLLVEAGAVSAVEYPIPASCAGENVRLREDPSTEAKIVGKMSYDDLYVLSETSVNGEVWYEIDHPTQKGTAWIFGKYVNFNYKEDITPAIRLSWQIELTFGTSLEKARLLFGKPTKENKKMTYIEGAGEKLPDITLTWPTHTAQYVGDGLTLIRVTKGTMPFGSIRIGDPVSKVTDLLGAPGEESEENQLSYEVNTVQYLTFMEKDGKISTMEYTSWFD